MVGHYPAKFGSHGHSDSGDIAVLVCHVISQGHVTKGDQEPIKVNYNLAKSGGHRHCGSGNMTLVSHVFLT